MNYLKVYNRIVMRAKLEARKKSKDSYYEAHHIIPRCMGGKNEKSNIALLTPKEHFLCHLLLHTAFPNNHKLFYAFYMMCKVKNKDQFERHNPSGKMIEYAKTYRDLYKAVPSGEGHYLYGKKQKEETKLKISQTTKGRISGRKNKPATNRKSAIDLETGRIFQSLLEASKFYGVSQPRVSQWIKKGIRVSLNY